MDLTPRGLVKNWLPHVPSIIQTAFLAAIGRSPNTQHQEWVAEVFVQCLRPVLQTPAALLASQNFFCTDPGVWGRMWVSRYTIPPPASMKMKPSTGSSVAVSVDDAVSFAIDNLASTDMEKTCPIPAYDKHGVESEWIAYRSNARAWTRPPRGRSQRQMYESLLRDVSDDENGPVILYAHGGAFCLMDPANHRASTSLMAQLCDSRVLAVRYRLSPQSIFPGALMDMFLAYLSLISPPPDAYHNPIPGCKIVLAGDSSGSNLVCALQLLLSCLLKHGQNKIRNPWSFSSSDNDTEFITIPDPPTAALSLTSPWLDITRSLPSTSANGSFDFIAAPPTLHDDLTSTSPLFPEDAIWPSNPVRTETYCEAVMCAHPLVSPVLAPKDILKDFPPTYVSVGWEGMSDESEVFCRKVHAAKFDKWRQQSTVPISISRMKKGDNNGHVSGSSLEAVDESTYDNLKLRSLQSTLVRDETSLQRCAVVFDGYTAMPHTFSFIPWNPSGRKAQARRAQHIRQAVRLTSDQMLMPESIFKSDISADALGYASWTNSKMMRESRMSFDRLAMETGWSTFCGYRRTAPLTDEVVERLVRQGRDFRVSLESKLRAEVEERRLIQIQQSYDPEKNETYIQQLFWMLAEQVRDIIWPLTLWFFWQLMQFGVSI